MKFPEFKKIRTDIKLQAQKLAQDGFKQIFDRVDQLHIKNGVDKMGLDKFIDQCAYLAAGSGVISGSGGMLTMIVGMPVDFVNLLIQQFRVTMAIMYVKRGSYYFTFEEFMLLIGASLKVEAGLTLTKTMMEGIAEKLLLMLGTRAAERMVPVVGAVIGGTTNYLFVKRMAETVKKMQMLDGPVTIKVD